ncbi:MAG: hypothetical protein NTV34_03730 [Proteobacteria bacterium]|nr:hypothetical protein [Pseudomonadota bacterium]
MEPIDETLATGKITGGHNKIDLTEEQIRQLKTMADFGMWLEDIA